MPASVTIFAASRLIYLDAAVTIVVLLIIFYRRPRIDLLRWGLTSALLLIISYGFAQVGAMVYDDRRPFVVDHVRPLISHARDNGFPSDHALLAAALVALLLVAGSWVAIPAALVAFLIDWARVGAGLHHVIDVVGSSLFVGLGTLIAVVAVGQLVPRLEARLPSWLRTEPVGGRRAPG